MPEWSEKCAYCGDPARADMPLCTECYILYLEANNTPDLKAASLMLIMAGTMQGLKGSELRAYTERVAVHFTQANKKIERWVTTHRRAWGK